MNAAKRSENVWENGTGSDSEEPPRKRGRTDTNAIVSPEDDGEEAEERLKPEDDLEKYNHVRLRKWLKYINRATKQKITPRTQEFLRLHEDAYEVALDTEVPDKASQAVVQAMDQVYASASFYLKPPSPENYQHYESYLNLRRLELMVNYDCYLGQGLQQTRAKLKEAAVDASLEVQAANAKFGPPKKWADIADELDGVNMVDLQRHVYVACGVLGIDPNHMLWLIKEWAEGNRKFHNKIREHVQDCHWHSLAKQICRDLKELLNVTDDRDTATKYEQVLLSIRDEYFDVVSRDDPEHWLPNKKARKLIKEKFERIQRKLEKEEKKGAQKWFEPTNIGSHLAVSEVILPSKYTFYHFLQLNNDLWSNLVTKSKALFDFNFPPLPRVGDKSLCRLLEVC